MELTAEQLAEIMSNVRAEDPRAKGEDKRREPREAREASVVITIEPIGAPRQSYTVTVRNVSSKGLAILLNQWVARGDEFVLRSKGREGRTLSVLCQVAHCRRINANLFLVGAQFGRVLADGEAHPSRAKAPHVDPAAIG